MFSGVYTALVTPFRDGCLDEAGFCRLVERQAEAGVHGVVVASGAAGEGTTLSPDEAMQLLDLAVRTAGGQMAVISGASSNATAAAVDLVRRAEDQGVDGVIVSAPWYTRPSQAGVCQHFEWVAASLKCPIILGDAPERTCLKIAPETLAQIAQIPNVVGMEDASGDMARIGSIRRVCEGWALLSSHDLSSLGYLAHGGHGLISLAANVAPEAVMALYTASVSNAGSIALKMSDLLFDLTSALNDDPSPALAKLALAKLSLCDTEMRLPLYPCSEPQGRTLTRILKTTHIH